MASLIGRDLRYLPMPMIVAKSLTWPQRVTLRRPHSRQESPHTPPEETC